MSDWQPRLIARDIDGTLIKWVDGAGQSHEVIPDAVREAVRRAAAAGAHILLASGRSPDGMILVGRLEAAHDGVIEIAPGLAESLHDGDLVYSTFLDTVDAYVKRRGLDLPEDPGARTTVPDPPCVTAPLTRLDLAAEGISSVIWATGYGVDFTWIDVPVLDERGDAVHHNGVSEVPGLYFLGLQWLSKMNSSFLSGVGDDAAALAEHIAARR